MLEPIVKTITVPCDPKRAFEIFVDMPSWWPLEKRSMSLMRAGGPAKSLTVEAQQGGKIIELAADDQEWHWGTFQVFDPHTRLEMDFHMGLPADKTGQVEVTFTAKDDQTEVVLTHKNWEGYEDMAEMMYQGYGGSWDLLFCEHYGAAFDTASA